LRVLMLAVAIATAACCLVARLAPLGGGLWRQIESDVRGMR
jgi:hypothetical protein